MPKTIFFLVRSLGRGGAERQLVVLAKGLAQRGHAVTVAVFYDGGVYETELADAGVRVVNLGKTSRWNVVTFLSRLVRLLRTERPDVLHGYLGVPNILVAILKPLLPGTRIVWGVRASNKDLSLYDWLARLEYAVERRLARFADMIIANSQAGAIHAIEQGFPAKGVVVISNGIDTERFSFDSLSRARIRAEWHMREDTVLIGLVARLDRIKDHIMFLKAAMLLTDKFPDVYFVCVGNGTPDYSQSLRQMAVALGLAGRIIWTGARDDMPAVYSALDIASSTSISEGFSNTVAEAMACGVPCVVTDAGDSALIVGDKGCVVPPRDHSAFATAIARLIDLHSSKRRELGTACRARVVAEFGVDKLIKRTEQVLGLA